MFIINFREFLDVYFDCMCTINTNPSFFVCLLHYQVVLLINTAKLNTYHAKFYCLQEDIKGTNFASMSVKAIYILDSTRTCLT